MVAGLLIYYARRNRAARGATYFVLTMLLASLWAIGAAIEALSPDLSSMIFWRNVQYLAITGIPLTWLAATLQYTRRDRWLRTRWFPLLAILPISTLVIVWTNELHGLFRASVFLDTSGAFPVAATNFGPWLWVQASYSYILLLAAAILLLEALLSAPSAYRKQPAILLIGTVMPALWSVLFVTGNNPLGNIDITPQIIGLSGIVFAWGLFHRWLFSTVPVAHETVIEGLSDGIIVIDVSGCVIDFNPAARSILRLGTKETIGLRSEVAFQGQPELIALCQATAPEQTEIILGEESSLRHYEATVSRLVDRRGHYVGQVVNLRDITERKAIEQKLIHASFHDTLTGLYNRAYFEEEMHRLEAGRFYPITIVGADIDDLKVVNDTMGHKAGDELLAALAEILLSAFRKSDVVARVGGDEFGILLPRTDKHTAESICQRLEDHVENHNRQHNDRPLRISWGASTSSGPTEPLELSCKIADLNMYRDKLSHKAGGSRSVVDTLVAALATKDHASGGHLKRVGSLAVALGREAGLSRQQLSDLALLAEVHDLGKMGIPDRILFKRSRLTVEERREMEQHSVIGYKIAKSSPSLEHVAELILHHHECWDGTGYPDTLSHEDIPVACRVLAIVDSYDAMTNDRPYRKALSVQQALGQIASNAGTLFDPLLAGTFVEMIGSEIRPGHPASGWNLVGEAGSHPAPTAAGNAGQDA